MANDLWRTPPEVVQWIEKNFGKIEVDLCASEDNAVCQTYIDKDINFLEVNDGWGSVSGITMFCNPPYSNPLPFVKQCARWSIEFGYAVVMLLNNDSSTKWFKELVDNASVIMPITGGRIAFLDGGGVPVKGNSKPQLMAYFSPFGRVGELQTRYVSIDEIYKGQKDERNK